MIYVNVLEFSRLVGCLCVLSVLSVAVAVTLVSTPPFPSNTLLPSLFPILHFSFKSTQLFTVSHSFTHSHSLQTHTII